MLKIAWICHFTNTEIQSFLPLWRQKNEFASWIPNFLNGFENCKDVEIHVIAPHEYLKKYSEIRLRNVYYHFIPYGIPIWHRHWPRYFRLDVYSNFIIFRKKVSDIINKIVPDIVNLIGAENAYYSASILDIGKAYPVLVTIQGFIGQFKDKLKKTAESKMRIDVEEKILKTFKYYCGEQDSSNYLSSYNPEHRFFRIYFPVNEKLILATRSLQNKYDCVYFGKLTKSKGIEDFIGIITEIKNKSPNIKACIIGGGDSLPFKALAQDLKCDKNIDFIGFLRSQKELFAYVKSSKIFVMPTYIERLASTIREAMFLKVPVVAYATGGIPYINEFNENIFLVETGDKKELLKKVLFLLENDKLRNELADRAYEYCQKEFRLVVNTERLMNAYRAILNE